MSFLKSDSGAVTVEWVVVTAAVVGLGLSAVTVSGGGVRDLAQGVADQLTAASIYGLAITDLPSAFSSAFDAVTSGLGLYASGDGRAHFELSDAMGSVSGNGALVITSGGTRNGGGTFGGAYISIDTSELEAGATYRVSYSARTAGGNYSMTLSNQSGRGDQSSLSHTTNLTGEWQQYTYEAVLDVERPIVYIWTQGANQTIAIDDLRYERLN